jgi:hypothetical protein
VHGKDVRMAQAGRDPDLLEKSVRAERSAKLRAHDLHGDWAIVP